jgi:molybdopterin synthase sulfur carrier subunit
MMVRIRLFALARDLCGAEWIEVLVPETARIVDLRAALSRAHPALSPLTSSAMFAVGAEYVSDDFPLNNGGEVACILPVSGG